jgi:lysozyme family protein
LANKLGYKDNATNFLTMPNEIWDKILAFGFWNPMICYKITSNYVANIVVDFAWGSGISGAKKSLKKFFANKGIEVKNIQDIVNELNKEIVSKGETNVAMELINHRKNFFKSLKNFSTYGKGWFNRLNSLITFKPLQKKQSIGVILLAFFFIMLYNKKLKK